MNLNFRKTALLVGICSAVSLTYTPQLFAASVDAIDAVQQAKKITGTVTDAMGPVIGANVLEKGTTNGVIADIDGNFTLNVQPGATIVVSFIGYQPQEIVVGNQTSFKIQLKEDTELLDEVVVVGYGVQKKKLVTGATVEVKGEDIAKLNTTQALGALQSQSPGVNIQAVSGQPGDGFKINIRGAGTNGNTAPVYVIDGVAGGDINALNPADIERIDVLKDAASCAIYGSSGANGVILITTKQGKAEKMSITYTGSVGFSQNAEQQEWLDGPGYAYWYNKARELQGDSQVFTAEMVQKMKDAGIPAALSYTAGSYVCNYLMYTLLYLIDKKFPGVRGGFIHVPYAMEQVVNKPLGTPSMDLHQIARGLEKAVEAIVESDSDIAVNMGTTH